MNNKVLLLLVGLVVGGVVGYLTRPGNVEFEVGGLNITVQDNQPLANDGGGLDSDQLQHIAIFLAAGAVIGLALGFAVDTGRRT
jgi:hypothetical protein